MERGLFWLPLLGLFIGLTWAGWNEYRKLEAYKLWAAGFERAKYDIYAVLGQSGATLRWGRPTRKGPENIQQVFLNEVSGIALYGGDRALPSDAAVPKGCQSGLGLTLKAGDIRWIPFTDYELAAAWKTQLQTLLESLESTPRP